MSTHGDGGSAFPQLHSLNRNMFSGYDAQVTGGMTLRDYFVAKAMHAAAVNPVGAEGFTFAERATWAYQQADAMLAAREAK